MLFPVELLGVPVSVASLFLFYFFLIYFFNQRLYVKHFAVLTLFFKKPVKKDIWSILKFLVKLELFLTIFLPSKILLHNGIFEKSTILWAFYTVYLSLVFWFFLISNNVYFCSLSVLYFILHVEILVFAFLIKNDFLKMNIVFALNLSYQEFDEIVFFYLGNTHFKTVLSSAAAAGTTGVAIIAEMSREYSIASISSFEMYHHGVKEAEAAIEAHGLEIKAIDKQIDVDRVKNFEYYRNQGFSREASFSKAESIADKGYLKMQQVKKPPYIVDSLMDLGNKRRADFDQALGKQPLYNLIPQIKELIKK